MRGTHVLQPIAVILATIGLSIGVAELDATDALLPAQQGADRTS